MAKLLGGEAALHWAEEQTLETEEIPEPLLLRLTWPGPAALGPWPSPSAPCRRWSRSGSTERPGSAGSALLPVSEPEPLHKHTHTHTHAPPLISKLTNYSRETKFVIGLSDSWFYEIKFKLIIIPYKPILSIRESKI